MSGDTLSVVSDVAAVSLENSASLCYALAAGRPLAGFARFDLSGIEEVALGRARSQADIVASRHGAVLTIEVPDPRMSGRHACIERSADGFVLVDAGSKNHSFVNGEEVDERVLADGDLIEVGHTFFVFRSGAFAGEGALSSPVVSEGDPRAASFSPTLRRLYRDAFRIATSALPILLGGPSGSGKEVLAQAIHRASGRPGAFVPVNCGAIAQTLVESELFGYRKGAFSGAVEDRVGLVRAADGGTLFLDEVTDLSMSAQTSLLRVVEQQSVLPVGATKAHPCDVRFVSASHKNLREAVARGAFREDLYSRLAGFTLALPPLAERPEDLGWLVASFVAGSRNTLSINAARALFAHGFPLQVRELKNRVTSACVLSGDAELAESHLFPQGSPVVPLVSAGSASSSRRRPQPLSPEDEARRELLRALVAENNGNISAVARQMGKARNQIQRWMKRYGL